LAPLLLNLALGVLALATLAPLLWMVSASLMPAGEASAMPLRLLPSRVTLDHYADLFERLDLGRCLRNSLLISTAVTALSLLLNSLAGYAFAKLRFPGRARVFGTLLAVLVVPAQVAMLPLFLLLRWLGLINSLWGVIIPGTVSYTHLTLPTKA
jgi:multiple sugar transport system permease protein